MQDNREQLRTRVLDPVDRVTEVIFGLLMAMTFTGTISVATANQEEERTMMIAALGCNLAWGLADAVMYLLRTVIERTRNRTLFAGLRAGADASAGQALIADALPPRIATAAGTEGLEVLRQRLVASPATPNYPVLRLEDFKGALGVFLLVVLATFPLVVLFVAGWILARYAGAKPWQGAVAMAVVGAALITAIIALGG